MFRAIVSDLDGTLLNKQHQISPYSQRVLRALAAKDTKLILASGRPFADIEPHRRKLGEAMYLITCNGAQVYRPDGSLLSQQALPAELYRPLVQAGRDAEVHINVYQGQDWLVEAPNLKLLAMHEASGYVYQQCDLLECTPQNIVKVFFEGEPATLQQLETALNEQFAGQLNIAFSLPNLLEVMAPGVNKGDALHEVLSQLDIHASQVMAFGDGLNDLELLQSAGRGLLMANAHPRLKAQLNEHEIIGSHCADAVACYLQKALLRDDRGSLPVKDVLAPHPCQEACSNGLCDKLRHQLAVVTQQTINEIA